MKAYAIQPQTTLVFRSGRPFGQGGDAQSLAMPLPSTLAGAVRTCWGEQQKHIDFSKELNQEQLDLLRNQSVLGPLLMQESSYLFPQPADAVYLNRDGSVGVYQLKPGELPPDTGCDLPAGLSPVFMEDQVKGKPAPGPLWWEESHFNQWLKGEKTDFDCLTACGWAGPQQDLRTHVALDHQTKAGLDGLLYQTTGVNFHDWVQNEHRSRSLMFGFDGELEAPGLIRLGGEGRPSILSAHSSLPRMPEGLSEQIGQTQRLRLILLTPAIFSEGWRPAWLNAELEGTVPATDIRLKLKAAAIPRWEPVSGWDLKAGKPRAIRRMVPAGGVYWFEILEGADKVNDLWLRPVSDNRQDRQDGFGIMVPGAWN